MNHVTTLRTPVGSTHTVRLFLGPNVRNALLQVLPGTSEQQELFLTATERALDHYRRFTVPTFRMSAVRNLRLARLRDAAVRFADAVARLDGELLDVLLPAYFRLAYEAKAQRPAETATLALEQLLESGARARIAAQLARKISEGICRDRTAMLGEASGETTPILLFVRAVGEAYATSFGQRPTAEDGGSFRAVLATLKREAGLDELAVSRARVRRALLASQIVRSSPPAKRRAKRAPAVSCERPTKGDAGRPRAKAAKAAGATPKPSAAAPAKKLGGGENSLSN